MVRRVHVRTGSVTDTSGAAERIVRNSAGSVPSPALLARAVEAYAQVQHVHAVFEEEKRDLPVHVSIISVDHSLL